ncbi:hypothetical protein L0Z14_26975 [Burkholderia multivorans]|uniref:hypothetical protein n=1 Tax=Burkholderia multivorans TaxID=87883 RepID=UPI000CFE4E7D|nr:hypothetical protein [Burkholderia multivorans]MCL4664557.1 hypothetical protein [Burkholderia multivorans]MCO1415865.1 hypothetical protein [Burkholderia multivorans]PRE28619.1 hypothetical protein C6P79_09705 [Burkholderia multivorans]
MKSSEIFVADAQIGSFSYQGGRLAVLIRADSGIFEVIFHTVLGMKAISPEGQDLSHLAESTGGAYLIDTCEKAEEPADGFREFSFISAWNDEPLLTVIAIDVQVSKTSN